MNGTYDTKTSVRAKVALLGLFVAALLSARLIVALRSVVVLSEPTELAHAGLSVAMPHGNGWDSAKRWVYKQDAFTLIAAFPAGSSRPTASARCTYVFPAEIPGRNTADIGIQKHFERRRRQIEGEIVETGQIETDAAIVEWVHIERPEAWFNVIFGTGKLPYNRRIDIEVREGTGDADLVKRTFKAIAATLSVTNSPLLEAGGKIIAEMKDKGLGAFLDNQNQQGLFLISDLKGRVIGFATDIVVDTGRASELNIEAMGLYYTRGLFVHEQMSSFRSNNRFESFTWKIESVAPPGALGAAQRSGTGIVLEDTGILTITKSGLSLGDSSSGDEPPEERFYRAGATAIPEILLEQLLAQMIESGTKEMLVDMIRSDGLIVPTHISQIESEDTAVAKNDAYLIKLMPLNRRGFFQLAYLDERKHLSSSLVRRQNDLIFERAEPADVARLFPERSEFILHSDKLEKLLDERI
ncbi:MAG: hypothetical protein ISS79_06855 [Phycisphaerae bacterium]|nr:hypothetical protein [Phycisphaerae bacterium]